MKDTYSINLPLIAPISEWKQNHEALIDDLILESDKIPFVKIGDTMYSPSMRLIEHYSTKVKTQVLTPVEALEVKVELPKFYSDLSLTNPIEIPEPYDSETFNPLYFFIRNQQVEIFIESVFYFICITQVAIPRSINTYSWEVFVNDELLFTWDPFENHHTKNVLIPSWPSLMKIGIAKTWNWFSQNEFTFMKISNCSISRACCGLTYLFTKSHGNINHSLFWSMHGIESLYVEVNTTGIQAKLVDRIPIILGNDDNGISTIKKLYDFRSRFVHGDLNIRPAHSNSIQREMNNPSSPDFFFYFNIHANELIALHILLATFQYMIQNDLSDLNLGFNPKTQNIPS